jgi:hypothetical protein
VNITLSYVITFKDEVYHLFENILFTNYSKSLFDDRRQNGLVYLINFGGDKLVLHLHLSNLKLHSCSKLTSWPLVTGIVILFDFDTESISVCNCFARFNKCSLNQYVHALPWMCSFKFDRCRWRTSLSPPKLIKY